MIFFSLLTAHGIFGALLAMANGTPDILMLHSFKSRAEAMEAFRFCCHELLWCKCRRPFSGKLPRSLLSHGVEAGVNLTET